MESMGCDMRGFAYQAERQKIIDECIVRTSDGLRAVSVVPKFTEGRGRKAEVFKEKYHHGIIKEEAETRAGSAEKLVNAVNRGAVKCYAGLYFFPNFTVGPRDLKFMEDKASRPGQMQAGLFDKLAA